jgi:hypothetical protein
LGEKYWSIGAVLVATAGIPEVHTARISVAEVTVTMSAAIWLKRTFGVEAGEGAAKLVPVSTIV